MSKLLSLAIRAPRVPFRIENIFYVAIIAMSLGATSEAQIPTTIPSHVSGVVGFAGWLRGCLAVLLLLALASFPLSAATGTMQFRVKDSRTHHPLQASITGEAPSGFTLTTDVNGRGSIDLPAGEYRLEISASGYNSLRTHYAIKAGKTTSAGAFLDSKTTRREESRDVLDPMFRSGYTLLHEYVVDAETGEPITGVKVRFVNAGVEALTDSDGHFYLSAPTPKSEYPGGLGTDTLVYEKPGYKTLVIKNFGIASDDMGGIAVDLERGKGTINVDGTHPLMREDTGNDGTLPTSAPEYTLSHDLYAWLGTAGTSFPVESANSSVTPTAQSIAVPSTIRVGHNCTKKVCTTWDPPISLETYV